MKRKHPIDYNQAKVRREILIRQRRELWTPEQVASLARHFRLRPRIKMLDVGCGFGYAMRTWGRYCLPGGKLVGLDRDKKLLATAKRLLRREGLGDSCEFVQGDACSLPFKDNTFDMVLAHVVFCHLARPEKALDEMIRVARPGGCVAVFDNAIGTGLPGGWSSWHAPSVRELLLDYEVAIRMRNGRRKQGHGDFAVGCYVLGWMEARGIKNVGARMNERVTWMAPPYGSPEQQTAYQNTRERMREQIRWDRVSKNEVEQMRAGGLPKAMFDRSRRLARLANRAFRRAMRNHIAAYAWSTPFWCIWGFKP